MIDAKEVKPTMSVGELAIRIEKRWIMRDSPVQQIDCLDVIRVRVQKSFGARVKIERANLGRRGTLDGALFAWRKVGLQLFGNRLRDLALNRKHVRQIAVMRLFPEMPVGTRIQPTAR